MPDINWNKKVWDSTYNWEGEGEEWSVSWGSSYAQWISTIYPRISLFLPAENILEIATGYGRWSRFLINMSNEFHGVDIAEKCIENCKKRFNQQTHAQFIVNDGVSLEMIQDSSVDFVFSFDSLVHVEFDILSNYIRQIISKLKKNGVAFIHHSNFEKYERAGIQNTHFRAATVSSEKVYKIIEKNRGKVIVQEKCNWGEISANLIDGFTLFCKEECDKYLINPKIIDNSNFSEEISYSKNVFNNYVLNLKR